MIKTCVSFCMALLLALPVLSGAAEPLAGSEPKAVPSLTATPPPASGEKPAEQAAAVPAVRIGYADIIRVAAESNQGKAAQARIKERGEKLRKQLDGKKKQLEKQKAAIEAKLATLTPQQREAKAREFEKKLGEFQKAATGADKELQGLQEELTGALYRAIEQAAVTYGTANGFAAIVVKKELLYLAGGVEAQDVTDELVRLMNAREAKP